METKGSCEREGVNAIRQGGSHGVYGALLDGRRVIMGRGESWKIRVVVRGRESM